MLEGGAGHERSFPRDAIMRWRCNWLCRRPELEGEEPWRDRMRHAHPHGGQRVLMGGAPLETAAGALIAIHGRGAGAEDIIALAKEVAPPNVTILAPQAAGNTWYPYRFLEPTERNEPYLSSALRIVADLIAQAGGGRYPVRAHRAARVLPGSLSGPGGRGTQSAAVCRRDRVQRRADRSTGDLVRLRRFPRQHTGVHRVQRRRSSYPEGTGRGVGRGVGAAGSGG